MVAGAPQRDDRRAQLLDVALVEFAERGYHETTVAHLIERAGVARGTFYNYFDSKRQIFEELLGRLFDAVNGAVRPIATGDPAEVFPQVRANILGLCSTLRNQRAMARVLLQHAVGLDKEATQQLQAFYARVLARITKAVRDGQALGVVRAGEPEIMATCLLGMLKEPLLQELLGRPEPALDALVDEVFQFAAHGILAR